MHRITQKMRYRDTWIVLLLVLVATLAILPMRDHLILANVQMIYLLLVFLVAVRFSRHAAILASLLSVTLFAYFFVPPLSSFAIIEPQYLLLLGIMLLISLVTSHLTTGLHTQLQLAEQRQQQLLALYQLACTLTSVLTPAQIIEPCRQFITSQFQASSIFLFPDNQNGLTIDCPPGVSFHADYAQQLMLSEAFLRSHTFHRHHDALYIPLRGTLRLHGILVITPCDHLSSGAEQEHFSQTYLKLTGLALERVAYASQAQHMEQRMESEQLRNLLLSGLSHDLRTPIAAMASVVDAMQLLPDPLSPAHLGLLDKMRKQVRLMLSHINKLLDMARLRSERLTLHTEWHFLDEVVGSAIQTCSSLLQLAGKRLSPYATGYDRGHQRPPGGAARADPVV
jgi:two-component system sensor histidine kinase KdpD